jgi:hypothetical protein
MTQWGLDTLFNPAKRHMDEEKRRLQATRQEVGDTSGGKRIDLESGKVRIGKRGRDEADEAGDATDVDEAADAEVDEAVDEEAGDAADSDATAGNGAGPKGSSGRRPTAKAAKHPAEKPELTPAQIRAAERRRRQAR